ncbi:CAMKK/CAMKK-META protein kinase [Saprolegnia diclina VS20]|uniref:CAMKK/CAMKK-META protein kinase n=1 Tax=Saprolegnia diclina (strain VS20) TaxID=1156394 RepID=T0R4K5_SAPDV|nr:CAMKK/CAMKK-META protein kinase [Saprolegnia diclina VS20]EQC26993.1 CAMKK/CAMKK-META protein kinase [Saprolegnia diclina VS20]|eukprot:XP_008619595.1 CAMKK/CAMKK-META protein kinase [Saprolegnia diclina VS20]
MDLLPTQSSKTALDTLHEHHVDGELKATSIPPIAVPFLTHHDGRHSSFFETNSVHKTTDACGHKQLNQYILYDVIGKGAYGKVRKAFWPEKNRYFAVKIIHKKKAKKLMLRGPRAPRSDGLDHIRKESAIWKKLHHPNIVRLREVIDDPEADKIYLVSELIEGKSIIDGEARCTPLHEDVARDCFCQLIEGLEFLHFHKIIHRDIKPGNLLYSADGIVKITDFGQSQVIEDEDDCFRQTVGTGPFLAPEMLTGDEYKGLPIDVWACGVTLYLFVYGHLPFEAETPQLLYEKIKSDPITFATLVQETPVNPDVIDLLRGILNKDPAERLTTQDIRNHPWLASRFQTQYPKSERHLITLTPACVESAITPLQLYRRLKRKTKLLIAANKLTGSSRQLPILRQPSTQRHIQDDAVHHAVPTVPRRLSGASLPSTARSMSSRRSLTARRLDFGQELAELRFDTPRAEDRP